jgi:hypothetical protein
MSVVPARCLSRHDMQLIGNNVLPAVRRERIIHRPHIAVCDCPDGCVKSCTRPDCRRHR